MNKQRGPQPLGTSEGKGDMRGVIHVLGAFHEQVLLQELHMHSFIYLYNNP